MSSRPSRTTRSSTAATSTTTTAPSTRSTRSSSVQPTSTTSTAPPPVRRTTRATRSTTPAQQQQLQQQQEIKPVPASARSSLATRSSSRASSAAASSTTSKPSWNTARNAPAVSTPPQAALKRMSSLVPVPGSTLRPTSQPKTPGLLSRMTSRDSLRPGNGMKTPAAVVGKREGGLEGYDGAREPIKAYLRIRPAPPGVPLQSYVQVMNETDVLMVPPL
ncbi:hypothetical protein JCM11251_006769, partial [Rhodosporidiobolus azoricus]